MKYRLTFLCQVPVSLPVQYNHIIQAALLKWLGSDSYGAFLHDEGYSKEKRTFKLYTFSNVSGLYDYDKPKKKLIFQKTLSLYISFYQEESHSVILEKIEEKKPLRLGQNYLPLYSCELIKEEFTDCLVETISPVTIHSTFATSDGRKKTYYYEPREKDFSYMIRSNLIRKYESLYQKEPKDISFEIVLNHNYPLRNIGIYYNGFSIRGWSGQFYLYGSQELIQMALLSGIGARNGIGLGCLLQKNILKKRGY